MPEVQIDDVWHPMCHGCGGTVFKVFYGEWTCSGKCVKCGTEVQFVPRYNFNPPAIELSQELKSQLEHYDHA